MIRNNQNRRRRGGNNNNGPRPQQMNGGNNYGNRLDNRQRGNASQLLEKYRALARDAQQAGDRVTAEYYLQYADHYYRVLGDYRDKTPNDGRQRGREFYEDDATGFAGGDDSDGGDDEDQDGDRNDARGQDRSDTRGDEGRSQWRDDRGGQNAPRARESNRDGNRDGNRDAPREPRNDPNRTESRDRQSWAGSNPSRTRDENRPERTRDENRSERTRDENRPERTRDNDHSERSRDESRSERNANRERRPESRPAPTDMAISDEGPIPGLPGPATLRARRPAAETDSPRAERAPRGTRRQSPAEAETFEAPIIESAVVEATAIEPTPTAIPQTVSGDAAASDTPVAPRRRGRPRKIVESEPVEG
ncbi:DUF4167 domain-containing protein [Polymorphobacter fuscus]|uniref:DUF4167 domain-containing protein n=1 Tax=Sandarakinorhabdus fusca TaxID=1439888 RepID=A0A7C9KHV8_9SPHN|nr:DUF4167 domain-containing protein [Polymorphobacter fuscus]KAB7647481.1 DUF4167 domain-containing protein [Polymorphobacter fuscus]MQT16739.1 DUF4167 domain-containing protein [Polymorphobacter fuscus]NJC09273.1 hypothetical protein [Polymorphobacter fuscus]